MITGRPPPGASAAVVETVANEGRETPGVDASAPRLTVERVAYRCRRASQVSAGRSRKTSAVTTPAALQSTSLARAEPECDRPGHQPIDYRNT